MDVQDASILVPHLVLPVRIAGVLGGDNEFALGLRDRGCHQWRIDHAEAVVRGLITFRNFPSLQRLVVRGDIDPHESGGVDPYGDCRIHQVGGQRARVVESTNPPGKTTEGSSKENGDQNAGKCCSSANQ